MRPRVTLALALALFLAVLLAIVVKHQRDMAAEVARRERLMELQASPR